MSMSQENMLLVYIESHLICAEGYKKERERPKLNPDGSFLNSWVRKKIGSNTIAGPKAIVCYREYESIRI